MQCGDGGAHGRGRSVRRATLAIALSVHLACGAAAPDHVVGPLDLYDQIGEGEAPPVLDVREPWEFRTGHIPGALNVPHRLVAAQLATLALTPERAVVVYGESGARAARVAQLLVDSGYKQVLRLAGDMQGWRRAGLPVAVGDQSGQ